MKPEIAIILAKAQDNGIGSAEGLPWHIPDELKYFRARTMGKPVIMGRKTFLSLGDGVTGKPLKGRDNIVLTRGDFTHEGVFIKHDLGDAIDFAKQKAEESGAREIMIIGGEEIFKQAINFADIVYLTKIRHDTFPDTNAFLPADYLKGWAVTERETHILHERKLDMDVACDMEVLRRER